MITRALLTVIIVLIILLLFAGPASSATTSQQVQIKNLKEQIRKSKTVVRWWNNGGRWALATRRSSCLSFKGARRERVCLKARRSLVAHKTRILWASNRINRIQNAIYLRQLRSKIGNESAWRCIYSHEHGSGGWATNTGNGYYGGLQMDMSFQEAHGLDLLRAKGTANNWTEYEQMMVAQRAYSGLRTSDNGRGGVSFWQDSARGYNPWPNTARYCGLL